MSDKEFHSKSEMRRHEAQKPKEWWVGRYTISVYTYEPAAPDNFHHVIEYNSYEAAIHERDRWRLAHDNSQITSQALNVALTNLESKSAKLVEALKEAIGVTGSSTLHAKILREALAAFAEVKP